MTYAPKSESSKKPQGDTARSSRRPVQVSTLAPQHASSRMRLLQQALGNQGVLRRMEAGLRINDVNDPAEREADRVAAAVMAAPGGDSLPPAVAASPRPMAQRKCAACEEEEGVHVQRKETFSARPAAPGPALGPVLNSPGRPLDRTTLSFMENRFGRDFTQVRVHDDEIAAASALSVNARAYTVGNQLVFGQGRYVPGSRQGKQLLAHELAHVVQQSHDQSAQGIQRSPLSADEIQHLSRPMLEQRLAEAELELQGETDQNKIAALWTENGQLKAALAPKPQPARPSGSLPLVALRDITPAEARAFSDPALAAAMNAGKRWLSAYPPIAENVSPPIDYQRAVQSMLVLEHEGFRRQEDVQAKLTQAEQARAAAVAREAEKVRQAKEQFQKDYELSQRTPPFWSLFDPTIYRDPSRQIQNPLLRAQSELANEAVRGHAQVLGATTAVVTGVAAGAVVLALGALALPATAALIADAAAVASPTIARGYVLAVQLTVEQPQLVEFAAGQVFKIALGGGIVAFLRDPSAEGALEFIHDAIIAYSIVPGGGRGGSGSFTGHVESAENDALTIRVTRGPNTAANDKPTFPEVHPSFRGGTAANDELPPNVFRLPLPRPQAAPVAVAAGQDFDQSNVSNRPALVVDAQKGDQVVAAAKPGTTTPPKVTAPPNVTQQGGGTSASQAAPGTTGTRFGRTYRINRGQPIDSSQKGFQVYEYRNKKGELLYVGKSGGAGGKYPINWPDRLKTDHIQTEWIGEAKTVTVTSALDEQGALALEEALIPDAKYNRKPGEHSFKFQEGGTSANAAAATKHGVVSRFVIDVLF